MPIWGKRVSKQITCKPETTSSICVLGKSRKLSITSPSMYPSEASVFLSFENDRHVHAVKDYTSYIELRYINFGAPLQEGFEGETGGIIDIQTT